MSKTWKIIITIAVMALLAYLVILFKSIVTYILLALVLAVIGRPLVDFFERLPIWKWRMPRTLAVILSLIIMLGILSGIILLFVPLITRQAQVIGNVDVNQFLLHYKDTISRIEDWLIYYGMLPKGVTIEIFVREKLQNLVNLTSFSNFVASAVSVTGSIFIGVFSVIFTAFFFLKDKRLFRNSILLLVPMGYHDEAKRIMIDSERMLTRYFLGVLAELGTMITLLTIGLSLFGIKNALLLGFIGGLMNIIPYLGPVIGTVFAVFLGLTAALSAGQYAGLITLALTIILIFYACNLVDNLLLQPFIFSSSVNAHPLEIFFVILMAGTLSGIMGMILAVPAYTVLRIIAREFFSNLRVVRKLTKDM